jgi:hypothetical protein
VKYLKISKIPEITKIPLQDVAGHFRKNPKIPEIPEIPSPLTCLNM